MNFIGDINPLQEQTFAPNFWFIPVSVHSPHTFGGFWTTEESKEKKFIMHKFKFQVGFSFLLEDL